MRSEITSNKVDNNHVASFPLTLSTVIYLIRFNAYN